MGLTPQTSSANATEAEKNSRLDYLLLDHF